MKRVPRLVVILAATAAFLAFGAPAGVAQTPAEQPAGNGLGISRGEMKTLLSDPALAFRFGELRQHRNSPVLRGETPNGGTEVFLSGPEGNLTSIAVFANVSSTDPKSIKNLIYAATIMNISVPGWDGEAPARWLMDAATKARTDGEQTTEKYGKRITVAFGENKELMLVAIQGSK